MSNGLAWSADGTTMYYVDSPTRRIVSYDYDVATGAIENPRPVFHVPEGAGFPDGMAIDVDGCLWVALWDGRRVLRVDPVSGDIADHIDMPVSRPTSCAFGGSAFDELFITSASNLPPHQLAREPHAGGVFRVRPGVKGFPAVHFAGTALLRELLDGAQRNDHGPPEGGHYTGSRGNDSPPEGGHYTGSRGLTQPASRRHYTDRARVGQGFSPADHRFPFFISSIR